VARLVRTGGAERADPIGPPLLPLVAAGLAALFLLAPWPLAHKAHALLHGLCAQRPSHTLSLGGTLLPFDARMTGIYLGFAVSAAWLLWRGRLRAWRLPPRRAAAVLAAFVALLAVDGSNALLLDIGVGPVYPPDNRLRLATGLLTGITLAVALAYVLATTLWRRGDPRLAPVAGLREVGLLVLLQAPPAAAALSGWGLLYVPLTLLLVGSATVVVGSLVLASITLVRLRDGSYESVRDLHGVAAVALVVAVVVMGSIAGARFWAEQAFGIVTLP
jgi:uncharacterized membrane protein